MEALIIVLVILLVIILLITILSAFIYREYLRYKALFHSTLEVLEKGTIIKADDHRIYVSCDNTGAYIFLCKKPYTRVGSIKVNGMSCEVFDIDK